MTRVRSETCTKCGVADWGFRKTNGFRYCKPCNKSRATGWNKDNTEKRKVTNNKSYKKNTEQKRAYYLQYTYGISTKEYDELAMAQCGQCAVCGEPETKVQHGRVCRLAVHHDHITGAVIALLCAKCNRGMGLLRDDPQILMNAALLQKGM